MKMKDLALAQVRRGERFTLDGVEFVKLEDDLDAAFAVAADTLPAMDAAGLARHLRKDATSTRSLLLCQKVAYLAGGVLEI